MDLSLNLPEYNIPNEIRNLEKKRNAEMFVDDLAHAKSSLNDCREDEKHGANYALKCTISSNKHLTHCKIKRNAKTKQPLQHTNIETNAWVNLSFLNLFKQKQPQINEQIEEKGERKEKTKLHFLVHTE